MAAGFDVEHIPPGAKRATCKPLVPVLCRAAREHYDRARTPYTVHDAENDDQLRERMFELTGGDPTVPAIVVDGKYIQSGWGSPPRG